MYVRGGGPNGFTWEVGVKEQWDVMVYYFLIVALKYDTIHHSAGQPRRLIQEARGL